MIKFIKNLFKNEGNDVKMSKVLYITANPKSKEQSFSLSVGDTFIEEYKRSNPNDEIINLDLYKMDIPLIDEDVFSAWGKLGQGISFQELSEVERKKVESINNLTNQFISTDKYIFVTPLWNFSVPPKMKAYIDTIAVAGKTFKYTENGPVGLLENKKALHIEARGGIYSEGPASAFEMGNKYLKVVLGFIGVSDIESIFIEGVNIDPQKAGTIKENAMEKARELAKKF